MLSGRAEAGAAEESKDIYALRKLAHQVEEIVRSTPLASRVRNDWGNQLMVARLQIDPDRANLAGVTNADVANSVSYGISGGAVATLTEGDKQIPVVARPVRNQRANVADVENLYVFAANSKQRVPLRAISHVD
jgi:multidrug efflux pump subunit AcrB